MGARRQVAGLDGFGVGRLSVVCVWRSSRASTTVDNTVDAASTSVVSAFVLELGEEEEELRC